LSEPRANSAGRASPASTKQPRRSFRPVVAAAVILNPKRALSPRRFQKLPPNAAGELALRIREHALAWAVAEVDSSRIDAWNIYQASRQAMTPRSNNFRRSRLSLDRAMQLDILIDRNPLSKGTRAAFPSPQPPFLLNSPRTRLDESTPISPATVSRPTQRLRHSGSPRAPAVSPTPLHRFSFAPVREFHLLGFGATPNPSSARTLVLPFLRFPAHDTI